MDDPELVKKYTLFENVELIDEHSPNIGVFLAVNLFYCSVVVGLDGPTSINLRISPFSNQVHQFILFCNGIIIDNFDHILISHDGVGFVFLGLLLGGSDAHDE